MVYDMTEPSSLEDIENFWIPEAFNYCDKNTKVLLLGNKCDCDKMVNN
jgi:GTPase SAR1 family protein